MRFGFQPPIQLSSGRHLHLLPAPSISSSPSPSFHHNSTSSFGIAFDIDGVILRGRTPIGNSPTALKRLYHHDSGNLKTPFLFLTNGVDDTNKLAAVLGSQTRKLLIFAMNSIRGGIPESRRAVELSDLLGVKILPSQVVQGHSSFRSLLKRFQNDFIVATGKGEPARVMSEYGFRNVISLEEYVSYFDNIDPVAQYKSWTAKQASNKPKYSTKSIQGFDVSLDRVKAIFIVSDPVDWGRDIQVLCDILTSGGPLVEENENQLPLFFAADDLQYQAAFPSQRLGIGAFRIALESVFNRIHHKPLECTVFGKPNPFVYRNAEVILRQLWASSCYGDVIREDENLSSHAFKTLYMIGDNPSVDIKGASQAGHPWFSILTRTGVFRQTKNHAEYPADVVVDTVAEAVEFILERESAS